MKRILNLNALSVKFLLVIGCFLIVLPAAFYAGSALLGPSSVFSQVCLYLAKGSAVIGIILLAGFIILVILEQVQDNIIYRQYLESRRKKRPLAGGLYECQFCGCRTVREFDAACPVCGEKLE